MSGMSLIDEIIIKSENMKNNRSISSNAEAEEMRGCSESFVRERWPCMIPYASIDNIEGEISYNQ